MKRQRTTVLLEVAARDVGKWLRWLESFPCIAIPRVRQNCPGHSPTAVLSLRSADADIEIFPAHWHRRRVGLKAELVENGSIELRRVMFWIGEQRGADVIVLNRKLHGDAGGVAS